MHNATTATISEIICTPAALESYVVLDIALIKEMIAAIAAIKYCQIFLPETYIVIKEIIMPKNKNAIKRNGPKLI